LPDGVIVPLRGLPPWMMRSAIEKVESWELRTERQTKCANKKGVR
jgi:hypothetical protein